MSRETDQVFLETERFCAQDYYLVIARRLLALDAVSDKLPENVSYCPDKGFANLREAHSRYRAFANPDNARATAVLADRLGTILTIEPIPFVSLPEFEEAVRASFAPNGKTRV